MRNLQKIVLWASVALLLLGFVGIFAQNLPTMGGQTSLEDRETSVKAWVLDGDLPLSAVLYARDGTDVKRLDPVRGMLHKNGVETILLRGKQPVAEQVGKVTELLTGENDVILVGYGSSALELLEAAQNTEAVKCVVLISPTVPDGTELPAITSSAVFILDVTSDRVYEQKQATEIYNRLSGDTINPVGFAYSASKGNFELRVISEVFGIYQTRTSTFRNQLASMLGELFGIELRSYEHTHFFSMVFWLAALVGTTGLLYCVYEKAKDKFTRITYGIVAAEISNRHLYNIIKTVMCLLAVPVLVVVLIFYFLFPAAPLAPLLCFAYLASYGGVYCLLLKKQKLPGTKGFIADGENRVVRSGTRIGYGVVLAVLFGIFMGIMGWSGAFLFQYTSAVDFVWLAVFGGFSFLGFYGSVWEFSLLDETRLGFGGKVFTHGIQYLPLMGLVFISVPISGFATTLPLVYMLMVYLLLTALCRTIYTVSDSPIVAATGCAALMGAFAAFTVF